LALPQFLAGLDVEKRQDEEEKSEEEHQQILHEQYSRMVDDVALGSAYSRQFEYSGFFLNKA
jgi:hypothetical protein